MQELQELASLKRLVWLLDFFQTPAKYICIQVPKCIDVGVNFLHEKNIEKKKKHFQKTTFA